MAPDKIYCGNNGNGNLSYSNNPFLNAKEYICKDALLEWLKKEYETMAWYYEGMKHVTGSVGDNSSSGKAEAYKKVIDKIESL